MATLPLLIESDRVSSNEFGRTGSGRAEGEVVGDTAPRRRSCDMERFPISTLCPRSWRRACRDGGVDGAERLGAGACGRGRRDCRMEL